MNAEVLLATDSLIYWFIDEKPLMHHLLTDSVNIESEWGSMVWMKDLNTAWPSESSTFGFFALIHHKIWPNSFPMIFLLIFKNV